MRVVIRNLDHGGPDLFLAYPDIFLTGWYAKPRIPQSEAG
jgi:hypothetical protein